MRHTRKHAEIQRDYEQVMQQYNRKVLKVFGCSCLALELAGKALFGRDSDLAAQVIADDERIDGLNEEINFEGMRILSSYPSIEIDLNEVMTLMRLGGMLEWLGDYSVCLARHVLRLNNLSETREVRLVEPVLQAVLRHVNRVRKALEERNFDVVRDCLVFASDRENCAFDLTNRLVRASRREHARMEPLAELIFISRSLEHVWLNLEKIEGEILQLETA